MSRLGDILLHKGERRGEVKTKGKKLRLACVGQKSKYAAITDGCHSDLSKTPFFFCIFTTIL